MSDAIFDPNGTGYDMETAEKFGLQADETGHWPSRAPNGQILKGATHETFEKTVQGEKDAGYVIARGKDGRLYSQPEVPMEPDLSVPHDAKAGRREVDAAVAWGQAESAEDDGGGSDAPAADATADQRNAKAWAFYDQAAINFERARPDIETGKLPTYPTWDYAQQKLAELRPKGERPKDPEAWWEAAVRNVSPLEAAGGVLDYADNVFETIRQISAKGDEALMRMGVPAITSEGLTTDFEKFKETKNVGDALPDIGDPEKAGLARGLGRFMAGFAAGGKALQGVAKLRELAEGGRAGASAVAALKGALSDFSGVRSMEENLANLVQENPTLANPVAEFLAADEDSPEIVNKLKTAFVGAGVGMALDGFMAGLRAIRASRQIEGAAGQMDDVASGLEREAQTQRGMLSETLGPIDDDRLLIEAGDAADQGAQSGARAGAQGPGGATNPRMNPDGKIGDVYINWSRIDTPEDVKSVMQDLADRYSQSIAEGQRGVRSHETTKLAAGQEDAWKILTERAQGTALNAEQTFAIRQLWSSSGTMVTNLAKRVEAGGGLADQLALKKMIGVHAAITEQVIGVRTETARALNQWKILAGESDQFLSGIQSLVHDMETSGNILSLAKGINRLHDAGRVDAVDAFVRGASLLGQLKKYGVNTSDAIRQLFYMSLLSGPKTTIRNSVSNLGMLMANVVDRRGAAYMGKILGGQNVPDEEATALLWGQVNGMMDAFRVSDFARELAEKEGRVARSGFSHALRTGESGMGVGKLDVPPIGAMSAEKLGLDPKSSMGRVMDWIDTSTRLPTNFLAAQDEVFRTGAFQGQIHALAYRQAWQEAGQGMIPKAGIGERAAELARDPSTGLRLLAQKFAKDSTFSNTPPADSKLYPAMRAIAKIPLLGKMAMAFHRVPYNIAIEFGQRSFMAPFTQKFREEIMAGGARADIAWTKFLMGNAALIALADVAIKGGLVGSQRGIGGSDAAAGELANKRAMGELAMTAKFEGSDGTVHSLGFRGMEPFSTSIGLAVNVVEILSSDQYDAEDKDSQAVVIAASAALMNQVTAPSFMQGLSELITFSDDPTRYGTNYAERLASIVVPNALGEGARAMDPEIRQVNGMLDAIKAKTPGLSKSLPSLPDRWGRDQTRASGIGWLYDMVSPFPYKAIKPEPIDVELSRLESGLAPIASKQWFGGVPVNMKMWPKEFARLGKLAGKEVTETVEGRPIQIRSIGYTSEGGNLLEELNSIVEGTHAFSDRYYDERSTDGSTGGKAKALQLIIDEYRNEARRWLLAESPGLAAKVQLRWDQRPGREAGIEGPNPMLDSLDMGGE